MTIEEIVDREFQSAVARCQESGWTKNLDYREIAMNVGKAVMHGRILSEEDVGRVARKVADYLVEDHGIVGISATVGVIIEAAVVQLRDKA